MHRRALLAAALVALAEMRPAAANHGCRAARQSCWHDKDCCTGICGAGGTCAGWADGERCRRDRVCYSGWCDRTRKDRKGRGRCRPRVA